MGLEDLLDQSIKKLDSRGDPAHQFARELAKMTALDDSEDPSDTHTDLVDILWGMDTKSWTASNRGNLFIDFQSAPHTHVDGVPIAMKILTSLSFEEINSRKEAIPEAYANTCSWIFRDSETDENDEQLEWPSFPTWLKQRDQEIYWITGKLGSGKSTLMKYIIENPTLQTHLQDYAGDLPCLQASFFFWNPGSEMATSREGLLRTLLHQCLEERPELIPAVAPRRWALYSLLGGEALPPRWAWKELQESFDILCSLHGQDFRLALFIDGLDEFKESDKSPDLLIRWIHHTATHYGIKICISSRPWNVFADAFGREPSLTMQNLSKRDIGHFVRAEFDKSIAFQELKEVFQDGAASIIKKIIEKAQGVFLWVNLVVHNLLSNLVDNPSLAALELTLAEIPGDMAGLYNAIWRSIPNQRKCRSSKILQICIEPWTPCKAEIMWLATEDNPNQQAITNPGIHNVMRRVLDGHTRGICELVGGHVQFLHRSAADWIKEDPTRAEIWSKTPPDFDPNLDLLEACSQYHVAMKACCQSTPLEQEYIIKVLFIGIAKLYNTASADRIGRLSDRLIQATNNAKGLRNDIARQNGSSRSSAWSENWLVGCAAGAGFVDYVKTRIKANPSLLTPKRGKISILENAIFWQDLDSIPFSTSESPLSKYSYGAGRLEIIRFILETSPHWYKTAHGKTMFEAVAYMSSDKVNPQLSRWDQEVLGLLREFEYESSKYWRRKRNQGMLAGPINKVSQETDRLLRGLKNELGHYFGKSRTDAGG